MLVAEAESGGSSSSGIGIGGGGSGGGSGDDGGGGGGGGGSGGRFRNVSASGDFAGLLASLSLGLYFVASGEARKQHGVPLFCWLCPLNAVAAIATTAASAVLESASPEFLGPLAWASDSYVFLIAGGSALSAGLLGHGIANFVMTQLSPLVVSVGFLLMPVFAVAQGFALGLQGAPSVVTAVAAPIVVYGAFVVSVGGRERGLSIADILMCRLRPR